MIKSFVSLYNVIRKPGVVVHELSHLLLVLVLPGINVESVNLTSEVKHSGRYTGTRMFMISYAPLYINVVISYFIVRYSTTLSFDSIWLQYVVMGILLFFGASLLLAAIPSFVDAKNPVIISYKNVISNPLSLAPVFAPIIIFFSIPFLFITWVIKRSLILGLITEIVFMLIIFSAGLGFLDLTNWIEVFASEITQLDKSPHF